MKRAIAVYIRSVVVSPDIESYRYHRWQSHLAPGLAQTTLELAAFTGRFLEPDSATLLSALGRVYQESAGVVEVHDVGRFRGRLRALAAGVRRVPTVVVNGEKHIGLSAAEQALRALNGASH